jgi:Uma2 family endonuclease
MKNEPQPDAFVIVVPACGGQVRIDDEGYIVGSPEFIGEVSASSASYDLHDKLTAYQRNGVKEYLVWRVEDRAIDWFIRRGERFEPVTASADGFLKSEVFPGLWLDPAALMAGNLSRLFQVVNFGLETPDHRAFVQELERRRAKAP